MLIVDDFPLVRRGIAAALAADPAIKILGEAGGAAEAIELAASLQPDVVVLDLRLGDGDGDADGLALIKRLSAGEGPPAVLVLTAVESLEAIRDAAAAGARGYLSKRVGARRLRSAIVTVFGGGVAFDTSSAGARSGAAAEVLPIGRPGTRPLLTGREREVLALVARGHTDREVAERLTLSVRTVQNHLASVRRKTDLRRRSELASWAVRYALD